MLVTLPHDFENERTDKDLVDQFGVRPDFVVDSPDAVPATWLDDGDVQLYCGDAVDVLRSLPAESVQTCITSPPYWGLRDYGTGSWTGGSSDCDHAAPKWSAKGRDTSSLVGTPQNHENEGWVGGVCGRCGAQRVDAQLGLEPTPSEYVAALVAVFAEVWRVLRDDGTCWINLGDCYAHGAPSGTAGQWNGSSPLGGNGNAENATKAQNMIAGGTLGPGLKAKDLVGIPWKVAFALQEAGWYLRSDIIWAKPNPMPESVTDRPTKAHEYVFLLAKQPRYYYDADSIREPHTRLWDPATNGGNLSPDGLHKANGAYRERGGDYPLPNPAGRNARSVWEIATQPTPEAHFACVDDQTEALTPSGWKRHADLSDGDMIAMYDPEADECRFAPATFHRYDYDGELVAIEKRDSSQRLTPNHRCYARRRVGSPVILRADELKPGMETLTTAPLNVPPTWSANVVFGESMASLLGWYSAEGHNHHRNYVSIYQSESANPQHVETIRGLLVDVGACFQERKRDRDGSVEVEFVVRENVAAMLQGWGKRLDGAIGVVEAEPLLDALIDGDGHRRPDGRSCIVQKDKQVIDRMQILALRLGYRAIVSERSDGMHVLYLTRGRWLTLRGTNGTHEPIGREPYAGIVWCPSVETGLWMARRRGRPFITGNTFPEALVRRCILAGSREGDQVLDPFVGSGTTCLVARKHGRRATGIDLSADYLAIAARRLGQQSLFALDSGEGVA